jgi:hypothetical protein
MEHKIAAADHRDPRQQVSKVSTIGAGVNSAAPGSAISGAEVAGGRMPPIARR